MPRGHGLMIKIDSKDWEDNFCDFLMIVLLRGHKFSFLRKIKKEKPNQRRKWEQSMRSNPEGIKKTMSKLWSKRSKGERALSRCLTATSQYSYIATPTNRATLEYPQTDMGSLVTSILAITQTVKLWIISRKTKGPFSHKKYNNKTWTWIKSGSRISRKVFRSVILVITWCHVWKRLMIRTSIS